MGGGVAAAIVAVAHRAGLHLLDAEQRIRQRRFARAGTADQHDAPALAQPRLQRRDTGAVLGVHRAHRHLERAQFAHGRLDVGAVLVRFGQHHHRLHAAAADQQQVALDPARIEVGIQSADHEHGVDVGGDHLLPVMLAGRAALDRGETREQGDDAQRVRRLAFDEHPVADRRACLRRGLALAVAAGALPFRQGFGAMGGIHGFGDQVAAAVLFADPGRAGPGMRRQQSCPGRIQGRRRPAPADGLQGRHADRNAVMWRF